MNTGMPPQGQQLPLVTPPPGGAPPPTETQQPGQQPGYAPTVAPNPPETNQVAPPPPDESTETKGRGRPKGARNKTFSLEQQVFMSGVTAIMGNPNFDPTAPGVGEILISAGELTTAAFNKKFGG